MAYTTINKPSDYFNTVNYTGTAGGQTISGVGHQPDFIWVKGKDAGYDHSLHNSVSGLLKQLISNSTSAEITNTDTITSNNADGFVLGADTAGPNANSNNQDTKNYVAWNWKAGTTAIPSGSTTDPLGVSINTTSGFGIYKITSPASGSYVLKHGLGKKPKMVIVKDLEASQKWMVWSDTFSNATNDYIKLNSTDAKATYSTCWGTMNSTDCTISVGGTLDANNDHVVYIFTDTTGYCKHGSYIGNGDNNGTFIYTGFKPAFVMVKRSDGAGDWAIMDTKRNTFNVMNKYLRAQGSDAEGTDASFDIDAVSNGFKLRYNNGNYNASGGNYIYMCFAEAPLVGTNGVTAKAR